MPSDQEHIERAHDAVRNASDAADGGTREQLNSIEESLASLTEGSIDADEHADRVLEIERKLDDLSVEEADEETVAAAVADARDHLDAYRTDSA